MRVELSPAQGVAAELQLHEGGEMHRPLCVMAVPKAEYRVIVYHDFGGTWLLSCLPGNVVWGVQNACEK